MTELKIKSWLISPTLTASFWPTMFAPICDDTLSLSYARMPWFGTIECRETVLFKVHHVIPATYFHMYLPYFQKNMFTFKEIFHRHIKHTVIILIFIQLTAVQLIFFIIFLYMVYDSSSPSMVFNIILSYLYREILNYLPNLKTSKV